MNEEHDETMVMYDFCGRKLVVDEREGASDMGRKDITKELSEKVAKKLRRQFALVAQEVWVDPDHRVDFMAFSPGRCGRNAALEHGRFVFVEIKSCMADFKSGTDSRSTATRTGSCVPETSHMSCTISSSCRSACRFTAPTAAVRCGLRMTFV